MELNIAFGKALQRLRKSRRKTQEDFAVVSSRTYLSTLERGLKSPTIDKVDDISNLMGIHPLTLLAATYLLKHEIALSELVRVMQEELQASGFDDNAVRKNS